MRFRRAAHHVDAMLFDGTPERAAEISRLFGCSVAGEGSVVEVGTPYGRVYIGERMWVVRDSATKALSVVDDREFAAQYEAVDEPLPMNAILIYPRTGRVFDIRSGQDVTR